jgi:Tfp pilus assembly protein PilP
MALAVSTALFASACGGDEPKAQQRGTGRTTKAAPAPAAAAGGATAAAAGIDEAKVPAKYKNLDWDAQDELDRSVRDTRDPFQVFVDPVELDNKTVVGPPPVKGDIPFEVVELQLEAIITGTAIHKALVVDPRGMGHVIKPGDIVGRDEPKRVTRITRNEVVFKPLVVKPDGQTAETVKRLMSDEELTQLEEL